MKRTIKTLIVGAVMAVGSFVGAQAVEAATVTAQSGDCLSCIGNRYGVSVQAMIDANPHFANPDVIFPGQLVNVPTGGAPSRVAGVSTSQPAQVSPNVPAGVPGLSAVLGRPYVYGAAGPSAFDCSGLTQYLSAQRGLAISRNSYGQMNGLRAIGRSELWPGDIIVMNGGGHVGMYLGNNQMVHALNPSQGVQVMDLDYVFQWNPVVGYRAVGH